MDPIEKKYPTRQAWMDAVAAGLEPLNAPTKPYWHDPMRDELLRALERAENALSVIAWNLDLPTARAVLADCRAVITKAKAQQ